MRTIIFQVVMLFLIVVISTAAFIGVSLWAWQDNLLLQRRLIQLARHLRGRWRRGWRRWRDPDYRVYVDLIERYLGPVQLLSGLKREEDFFDQQEQVLSGQSGWVYAHNRHIEFREARLRLMPQVAEKVAAFNDVELGVVAENLVGFDFDHRPESEEDQRVVDRVRDVLIRQRDEARTNPNNILTTIYWLSELQPEFD